LSDAAVTERAARAKAYQRQRLILRFAGLWDAALFLAVIQFTGFSAHLRSFSLAQTGSFYPGLAVYFLVFSLLYYLFLSPLGFFGGFLLEHRFGLSSQSFARWFAEDLKGEAVSLVITTALVLAFYAIGRHFPVMWWLIASFVWLVFTILFAMVFPIVVLPIFYRSMPLADEALRHRLMRLADRFGIKVVDVSMIDYSKNTRKSNAALVGWGATRRIILTDTLVKDFSDDEIEVVVAHEMAHYAYGHIQKLVLVHALTTAVFFYLLSRVLPRLAAACGATGAFDMAILPAVALIFGLYSFVIMPFANAFSRMLEREADCGAVKATGDRGAFISLMKKLSEKNLSDENPHPVVEYLFYDHPPIGKRIRMAGRFGHFSEMPNHQKSQALDRYAEK
jgi:STE24 endopeptidase